MRTFVLLTLVMLAGGCSNQPKTASGDVPELIQQLENGEDSLRASAAEVLGELGADASSAVPALARALRDEYELVRQHAAWALGQIGANAKAAVPALILATHDGVPDVRQAAFEALGRIDPKRAQGGTSGAHDLPDAWTTPAPHSPQAAENQIKSLVVQPFDFARSELVNSRDNADFLLCSMLLASW